MAGTFPSRRVEFRSTTNVFVELYSFDNATFEITNTIDISPHGARVLSKTGWAPNQRVSIRALDGHLESRARIVYCEPLAEQSYAIGLELQQPMGAWEPPKKSLKAGNGM
jgi:hypothetical protein